ncbi:hypothetical protein KX729_00930 [Rhizobium sp. XQZ8]|uniref:hypothetical protein n=1 Tax=Rhizobium populisoli TaxID=2859785 RepID=UPI001CA53D94|nr:hypothetical protein [Rhizobium populisoli]MBW6420001.1 hypothetical protein [Rhizobium populisoli]
MFEKALLRKGANLPAMDVGLLAETLLFYQDTHVIVDPGTTIELIKSIGIEDLSRLVEENHITLGYYRNYMAAHTSRENGVAIHSLIEFHLRGKDSEPTLKWDKERELDELIRRQGFDKQESGRLARRILKLSSTEKMTLSGTKLNLITMANDDLRDKKYSEISAKIIVESKVPGFKIPDHWRFIVHHLDAENQFYVETNFDFGDINRRYQQLAKDDFLTEAHLIAEIFEARADMAFASKHMAEVVTSPARGQIMQAKFDLMNLRRDRSKADIELFQNIHFEGRQLREVMNSGERTFAEFLNLLDDTRKFKQWLKGANPEIGLVKEYHQAATRDSWLDKLPNKSFRFGVMTGVGALLDVLATGGIGTLGALALGAADTFLVDKMLKGWRPNQFVEDDLLKFIGKD